MLGIGRRTPLSDYPARRIAILKPSALGDIIHALPVLSALRHRFPDAHIAWVVHRGYDAILQGNPHLDAVIPFDRRAARGKLLGGAWNYARLFKQLHAQHFDLVVDLQGLFRTGLMALATGAPRRVGLSTAREGSRFAYTDVIRVADFNAIHAVDRCWLVAEAFGVGHLPKRFDVSIADANRRWALDALRATARPWLVLGVGARWLTKRWPPENFAELARRAQALTGGTVIFIGTGDERPLAETTARMLYGPSRNLAGETSLGQLAAVLAEGDVVLANDTGPLHLAAALGRPVVAPYTCTRIHMHGPYAAAAGAVETGVACKGSYLKKCRRLDCMRELTPVRLWPALEEVLLRWKRTSRSA
jgi:lipopolysaccharide heptosyltransferase I